mmetsp:Transcript_69690/g.154211  ORF Transcript_69690/g.154211 Transcript_69690/m.154211 type:complete len:93 (+) Transcript_69690:37-315(+)
MVQVPDERFRKRLARPRCQAPSTARTRTFGFGSPLTDTGPSKPARRKSIDLVGQEPHKLLREELEKDPVRLTLLIPKVVEKAVQQHVQRWEP